MRRLVYYMFCALLLTPAVLLTSAGNAQAEPALNAPESAAAGSDIEISVSGATSDKDFVTIVAPDTPEGKYEHYQYIRGKSSITLWVPEEPGKYEIRLLSGESGYSTLAARPIESTAVEASVKGPAEVAAGARFEISWTGPANSKDFITIVEKGAREGEYNQYQYPKNSRAGKPLSFNAPELPGQYELRYLSGNKRYTLASFPFTVSTVDAEVKAPQEVVAGASFAVEWSGPDNEQDFITIVPAEEPEGGYAQYKYVRSRQGPRKLQQVELTAPEVPGEYEVRYLSGREHLTLAAAAIMVKPTTASLVAPEEVVEGARFDVEWSGPDNEQDYITIVSPDQPEGETGSSYAYVAKRRGPRKQQVVTLTAPEESGDFEIRYITGGKRFTLAARPLKIVVPSAELDAPAQAAVNEVINVTWQGPGNQNDFVALVKPDSAENEMRHHASVRRGKTLRLDTPPEPGSYELRYVTGGKNKVLARRAIEITPSKVPGELAVIAEGEQSVRRLGPDTSVALILDASGSMLQREGAERRIEIAKKAVAQLLGGPLPEGTPFALRVFGHKEADSCRTDLEIPLAPLEVAAAENRVEAISAMNHAKTPIARSLELAKSDLEAAEGRRIVILVTDGEETCEGDPEAAIKSLAGSGFDTRVNIVGFAIDEFMLKETFQKWARLGNGKYFDAANAEQLEKSIVEAVEVPYEVLDADKKIVASGVVNGEAVSLLPGEYTVRVLSSPQNSIESVVVEPKKRRTLTVSS